MQKLRLTMWGLTGFMLLPLLGFTQQQTMPWEIRTMSQSARILSLATIDSFLFAATDFGLHRSVNGGRTWALLPEQKLHSQVLRLFTLEKSLIAQATPSVYLISKDFGMTWETWNATIDTLHASIRCAIPHPTGFLVAIHERNGLWIYRQLGLDYSLIPAGLNSNRIDRLEQSGTTLFAWLAPGSSVPVDGPYLAISNDLGQTWFNPAGSIRRDTHVLSFATLGRRYYAITDQGSVYASDDSGYNWQSVSPVMVSTDTIRLQNLAATPQGVLAGFSGPNLWVSEDSTQTWVKRASQIPTGGATPRLSWAAGLFQAEWEGNRYVSSDTGRSWTLLPRSPLSQTASWMNRSATLGDSAQFLISGYYTPDGGNEWVLAGLHPRTLALVRSGKYMGMATPTGFQESFDSGATWTVTHRITNGRQLHDWGATRINDLKCVGDTLWMGTDQGLYRKRFVEKIWATIPAVNHLVQRIETTANRIVAVGKSNPSIPLSHSDDQGRTWQHYQVASPEVFNPGSFLLLPREDMWIAGTSTGIYASQDHGQSWMRSNPGLWPGVLPALAPIKSLLAHQTSLWVTLLRRTSSEGHMIYRSRDSGRTWNSERPISAAFPQGPAPSTDITFLTCGLRLFFFSGDHVWMSEDDGLTWTHPMSGWPRSQARNPQASEALIAAITGPRQISVLGRNASAWREWPVPTGTGTDSVTAIAVAGERLLAAIGTRLYAAEDSGATWIPLDIRCGPPLAFTALGQRIFVSSKGCADLSTDGGRTWSAVPDSIVSGSSWARVGIDAFENTSTVSVEMKPYGTRLITTRYRSNDGIRWTSDAAGPLAMGALNGLEYGFEEGVIYQRQSENATAIRSTHPSTDSYNRYSVALTHSGRQGLWQLITLQVAQPGKLVIFQLTPDGRSHPLFSADLEPGLRHLRFESPVRPGSIFLARWNGQLIPFTKPQSR